MILERQVFLSLTEIIHHKSEIKKEIFFVLFPSMKKKIKRDSEYSNVKEYFPIGRNLVLKLWDGASRGWFFGRSVGGKC